LHQLAVMVIMKEV